VLLYNFFKFHTFYFFMFKVLESFRAFFLQSQGGAPDLWGQTWWRICTKTSARRSSRATTLQLRWPVPMKLSRWGKCLVTSVKWTMFWWWWWWWWSLCHNPAGNWPLPSGWCWNVWPESQAWKRCATMTKHDIEEPWPCWSWTDFQMQERRHLKSLCRVKYGWDSMFWECEWGY